MPCLQAVAASVFPNLGGFAAGFLVDPQIKNKDGTPGWYTNLKKPSWCPPDWVFGPVWTGLYTSMGYASYLVWRDGGGFAGPAKYPLMLYGTKIALNWAWTPLFFGMHKIGGSLVDIVLLYGCVAGTAHQFYQINRTAGYIFIPYILWLTLATGINYRIWRDNPNPEPKIRELKD